MEFDLVYGDLQLKVTLSPADSTVFAHLTSGELLALQQQLYLALNCFINTRALHLLDYIEQDKYKDCEIHNCKCTCHGG